MSDEILPGKVLILILLFFASSFSLFSQNHGTVRGSVYDKESGEPIIFTNVVIENSTVGSATDVNGFYIISQLPAGTYTLKVSCLGFKENTITVSILRNKILNVNFFLERSVHDLKTVTIVGETKDKRTESSVSEINITPKQINQLPSIGGQADIAQYIQMLPGVVFTGDRGGQLYIRGGSPVQNKVTLDGMMIFNPIHSLGLFSVFETDIIRNTEVYTGGFNARYSNAISSVMDITTRDGNRNRMAGSFGASTFGAKLNLEGPLIKIKKDRKVGVTFIASVKKSYLEESSKLFYDYVDDEGLPFNYLDIYSKLTLYSLNGTKLSVFGFHFDDEVNKYYDIDNLKWKSFGGGLNFTIIPGNSPAYIHGYVAFSSYKADFSDVLFLSRHTEVKNTNFGLDFTNYMGRDQIDYGFDIQGFNTYLNYINEAGIDSEIPKDYTTQLGFFIQYKKVWNKFILEPGIRLQWYATKNHFSPEPRLAMKYLVTKNFRLKASGGYYSQSLISGKSDMDVVNLFNVYLTSIDNYQKVYQGESISNTLQKSQHIIAGLEVDITKNIELNLEGYYKNFSQLFNFNRYKILDSDPNFIVETGDAEGVELNVKYENKNFYLWTVYSFSYVRRYFEGPSGDLIEYFPHYDRRHNLNILGTYKFGEAKLWQLGMRWNLASGLPYTPTKGYYERLNFPDGIQTDYVISNGEVFILLGELNGSRFPVYHRLDIDLKKIFLLKNNSSLEANISVTNVYDQQNIFYINRYTENKIYQFPILPSIGFKLNF